MRAALFLLALGTPALGQALEAPLPLAANDTDLLRSLLKFQGLEPATAMPPYEKWGDVVLVLTGDLNAPSKLRNTSATAIMILNNGGAVMIATDQTTDLADYFPQPNRLRVRGTEVRHTVPTRENCLDGRAECPFLASPPLEELPANPSLVQMTQLKRVATNRPSSFEHIPGSTFANRVLALAPPLAISLTPNVLPPSTMHVLAVCNDPLTAPTSGIAVAFADVGIFTNQMMLADGTDNFAYAFHLTRYLATGPDGKRKRTICIFLENGEFRTDFDRAPLGSMTPPIPPLPIPPWAEIEKKLVTMAQDQVNDLEDRDWFEGKVAPLARDIGRVLALVVAAWLIIVVLLRAFRTRHAPAQTPLPRPPDGPETIIERKRQEILQTNDVYEPLREHLREQFAAWHCPPGAGHLPPIDVDGTKKERRRIEADLKRLWGVAFGDVPERVSFTRWKDYEAMLSNLADDADEGVWRFTPGGSA